MLQKSLRLRKVFWNYCKQIRQSTHGLLSCLFSNHNTVDTGLYTSNIGLNKENISSYNAVGRPKIKERYSLMYVANKRCKNN